MSDKLSSKVADPELLQKQLEIARREIHNLRQQIVSLNHVHKKECEYIYQKLKDWQCMECRKKQNHQVNEDRVEDCDVKFNYIGKVHTQFPEKRGTPRQPGICSDMVAKLVLNNEVFTNPKHALDGLHLFSHMWILFHFHKNESNHIRAKVAPPRLNGLRTGVFATRSPHRPNPIGLSLVKIDRIVDNVIYFSGVDMINDTPVLDIKPFIPQYDTPGLPNLYYPGDNDEDTDINSIPGTAIDVTDSQQSYIDLDLPSTSSLNNTVENLNINGRVLDGDEDEHGDHVATVLDSSHVSVEEPVFARSSSRIGEREAPDGEEEENPRTVINSGISIPNTPNGGVRVPAWINQPPVSRLNVLFKERAEAQLAQLGQEGEDKKTIIANVLREDPRSIYLRERWGSHCYVFRIADLCVSCKFNDTNHSVTVYQVFQNETVAGGNE